MMLRSSIDDFSLVIEKGDRVAISSGRRLWKVDPAAAATGELAPKKELCSKPRAMRLGYFGQTSIDRLDAKMRIEEEILRRTPRSTSVKCARSAG